MPAFFPPSLKETTMKDLIQKFLKDESGATMVEYAILVALISVAAIVIIVAVGQQVNEAFNRVSTELTAGGVAPPAG